MSGFIEYLEVVSLHFDDESNNFSTVRQKNYIMTIFGQISLKHLEMREPMSARVNREFGESSRYGNMC